MTSFIGLKSTFHEKMPKYRSKHNKNSCHTSRRIYKYMAIIITYIIEGIQMSDSKKKFQENLVSFMQQKGFIWGPEPEIYGGLAGFYTYAPLGKRIKNNVESKIREIFSSEELWEVECPTIMQEDVWKASGHLEGFTDPLIRCSKCSNNFRADKLIEEKHGDIVADSFSDDKLIEFIKDKDIRCPTCGSAFIMEIKKHNLMMKTTIGTDIDAYNRPETATTTYLPFIRYVDYFRKKLPFGVFQIGKAYRNEISPRQHVLRMREFTQAEGQIFIFREDKENWKKYDNIKNNKLPLWPYQFQESEKGPKQMDVKTAIEKGYMKNKAYSWAVELAYRLFTSMGIPKDRIRLRQHTLDERAFYAQDAWDLEIMTNSFGWVECCGIHDRGDYDLTQHSKASGKKLEALDKNNEKKTPDIIEIAFGTDRPTFALLDLYYTKDDDRTVLKIPKDMSPIQVGVFPLVKKGGLDEIASKISDDLRKKGIVSFYDAGGSIGRRYARMDEKGTPVCVTVDFETKEDNTVTIRDRDTQEQKRINIEDIEKSICDILYTKN